MAAAGDGARGQPAGAVLAHEVAEWLIDRHESLTPDRVGMAGPRGFSPSISMSRRILTGR
jgi:hypothetical protein